MYGYHNYVYILKENFTFFRLNAKRRAIGILRKELNEIMCQEQRHQQLYNLIAGWVNNVEPKDLPPGLEFPDIVSNETVNFFFFSFINSLGLKHLYFFK